MNSTPQTKINSKWITDLNIKTKSIRLLKKSNRGNLCNLWLGKDFLNTTLSVQETKKKNTEVNKTCYLKDSVKRLFSPV